MASAPVDVKKNAPARTPDLWLSFHDEMDRLFDRFAGGFGMPSLRRWFNTEPTWTHENSFSFPNPAVDVTEDDKAYKITAELPGLEEKDIDVTVAGGMLTMKGEKSYEKDEKNKDRHTLPKTAQAAKQQKIEVKKSRVNPRRQSGAGLDSIRTRSDGLAQSSFEPIEHQSPLSLYHRRLHRAEISTHRRARSPLAYRQATRPLRLDAASYYEIKDERRRKIGLAYDPLHLVGCSSTPSSL